ncbi:diguanylate cyclase [Marinomonas sp. PE14-40]|uniref:diguanylate cyclase n=1 Tax=Marinomonas sp. PE14-40 TaxID=3060621 RepID=UPI003F67DD97
MNLLTTKQVVIRILAIIFIVELVIMFILQLIPHKLSSIVEAALDASILTLVSLAPIYFWVIKPFVDANQETILRINKLALTDPLTQLGNRRYFLSCMEKVISSNSRYKEQAAIVLIDLDGFKKINDEFGHEAGDALLVEVSSKLQSLIRQEDVVARLGGDEFVILLQRMYGNSLVNREIVQQIGIELVGLINQPIRYKEQTLNVGASVGIRLIDGDEKDVDALIRAADVAMYQAKKRNTHKVVFS